MGSEANTSNLRGQSRMPVLDFCCFKFENKHGSIAIGTILLSFTVIFTGVCVGFIAGWEQFDTSFLLDASTKIREPCLEEDYVGNCTNRDWVASKVENFQMKLSNMSRILKDIGPVWKNEFISLYNFLPWYALANVLLILGALKEVRFLLIIWLVATVILIIWEFTLLSILFTFDTTVGFVVSLAILQLLNFIFLSYCILIVFSFFQELTARKIKDLIIGRAEEYLHKTNGEAA